MKKIFLVAGARPNYVKIAPLIRAFKKLRSKRKSRKFSYHLINTGQHYDYLMSKKFFKDLDIPKPLVDLNVGSSSHADQTAKIMTRFEKVVLKHKPDLLVVVGDVNSTMACSLVAAKLGIDIAHVESGLRSRDWEMPEEINRVVTDRLSTYLFTTSSDADQNLRQEGVPAKKIFLTGNVMVDSLLANIKRARKTKIHKELRIQKPYAVLTLHRPSNVDNSSDFNEITKALTKIEKRIPIIFPVHPRTAARMKRSIVGKKLSKMKNLKMVPPVGYLDFMNLMANAKLMLTDSGGIQEETTVLGVPCLTLRDNTERPVTLSKGSNILTGRNSKKILKAANAILDGKLKGNRVRPKYWDGKAAERIVKILSKKVGF